MPMLDAIWVMLQIGLLLSFYSTVMAGVWKITGELMLPKDERVRSDAMDDVYSWDKGHPLPILTGMFWPLALPVILPFWFYIIFTRGKFPKIKFPKLPNFGKGVEQKVLDYAASPVLILSQLVAQRITREPELLKESSSFAKTWYWTSADNRIKVLVSWLGSTSFPTTIEYLSIDDEAVDYDNEILLKAVTQAHKFVTEKKALDDETQRQLKALSAVETLLLEPIKNY